MKISIITVIYNAADTIADCINSVLSQDYPSIEYIVIDGNSNDGSQEIIKSFGDSIATFVSEADNGIYDAMNKGINLASGDVIGLLNADDVYAQNDVLTTVANVFKDSEIDACYGDLQYVQKNDATKVLRNWKSCHYKKGLFNKGWMPPHPTFFLRKEFYLNYGMYNTKFRISADYELMLRMFCKHNIRSIYIPKLMIKMRAGGESNATFSHRIRANKEDRMAWKINNLQAGPLTLIKKPLSKIKQFWSL